MRLVWLVTVAGIVMLWNAARRPGVLFDTRILIGGGMAGWGLFNVVEGIIDHHILHLHHVYERMGVSGWDYVFLGWGAIMIVVGGWLIRSGSRMDAQSGVG